MTDLKQQLQQVEKAIDDQAAGTSGAHREVLKSINNLQKAAEGTVGAVNRLRYTGLFPSCAALAIEIGILQVIVDAKTPVTVAQVAKETKGDEFLIGRLLRMLSCWELFDEVDVNTFQSNAMSEYLRDPGQLAFIKFFGGLIMKAFATMPETYRKTGLIPQTPPSQEQGMFALTHGKPLWGYLNDHPSMKEDFDSFMAARHQRVKAPWHEIFPAAAQLGPGAKNGPNDTFLIDLGGGSGHDIVSFRKAHPEILGRFILQELPETIAGIKEPLTGNIETMGHSFFDEQPVKGARIYYFHGVIHDWTDEQCKQILSQVAKAMDKDYSRLLIDDWVLPDKGASYRGSGDDVIMMVTVCGLERTFSRLAKLLDSAGLEIIKKWSTEGEDESVVEAKLKG